jgi:hypothetical protein
MVSHLWGWWVWMEFGLGFGVWGLVALGWVGLGWVGCVHHKTEKKKGASVSINYPSNGTQINITSLDEHIWPPPMINDSFSLFSFKR